MPITPANQLFANTGLARNPILSSILFLQQRQQDERDRQISEEQRALENERAQEEFNLRKQQLELQQQQQQQQLQANEINRRVADFQFRTGAQSVPEAVIAGTLPLPMIDDPVSLALANVDRTGNVQPQQQFTGTFVDNPITGTEEFLGQPDIEQILAGERQRQQVKLAPQLLRMEYDAKRDILNRISVEERDRLNRESRERIASENRTFQATQNEANRKNQRDVAAIRGRVTAETFAGLTNAVNNGIVPTGDLSVDEDFWNSLDGTAKQIFDGSFSIKDIPQADRTKLTNLASRAGLVIPTFKSGEVSAYKNQKQSYLDLIKTAEQFVNEAPDPGTSIGSKQIGGVTETILRSKNDPSVATFDSMMGFVPTLKSLVGESGVLTNQDVERIQGLLPNFTDSKVNRQKKLQQLKDYLESKESAYFSQIPKAQREFMFARQGIPQMEVSEFDKHMHLLNQE